MEVDEERGRLDAIAVLYVLGGIPVMVSFFFLLFLGVKACGLPA